jgi:hypothetical protein
LEQETEDFKQMKLRKVELCCSNFLGRSIEVKLISFPAFQFTIKGPVIIKPLQLEHHGITRSEFDDDLNVIEHASIMAAPEKVSVGISPLNCGANISHE